MSASGQLYIIKTILDVIIYAHNICTLNKPLEHWFTHREKSEFA